MNKTKRVLIQLLEDLASYCSSIIDKLRSDIENSPRRTFEDLTPKSDLDEFDEYMEALEWALQNKKIKNIALTGPYGSGKSSILLSFFKKHKTDYEFFNISLASFYKKDMSDQQLEESILKQLFYSATPKKLPESRLKRVYSKNKKRTFLHSSLFVIWLISTLILVNDTIHKNFQDWLGVSIIPFTVIFIVICFFGLLIIAFFLFQKARRVNLSKLNLTPVEFELTEQSDSTFSKHLDEIIYFFECEKYNIVVFEDIDRFESKLIFTKLRELNTLLNQSAQVDNSIRFIYAVKDELFDEDKLRTKFFDFIIPIIPVINQSNSEAMLLDRLKSAGLLDELSKNLISGISIYIDDMRMLKNIYNEYVIYHDKLSSIGLVQDKLFSLIVYKNLFPGDFADLQYGKGEIPSIFQRKKVEVSKMREKLNSKIDALEHDLKASKDEHLKSIKELRTLYLAEFLKRMSSRSAAAIYLKGAFVVFNDVLRDNWFNLFKKSDNIQYKGQGTNPLNSNISFAQLENDLGHNEDYEMRLKSLHLKNDEEKRSVRTEIIKTKGEIDSLERLDLSEILSQENKVEILGSDLQNEKILFFLFSNGYIAENFQPYVSYFYEGPVTQNDYKFILSVNERRPLKSDFQIKNHQEVTERLRSEDFSGKEVLNFGLLNFLLKNQSKFSNQLRNLIDQLSNESEESVEFVKTFIDEEQNELEKFSVLILSSWKSIWHYQEEKKIEDITKRKFLDFIFDYSTVEQIEEINSVSRFQLSRYISNQESFINDYEHSDSLESLMELIRKIKVKFRLVTVDDSKSKLFKHILKFQLYELNRRMIRVILNSSTSPIEYDDEKFNLSNYTLIQNSGLELLKSYVNQEIDYYVKNVLIDFDDEINEQEESFVKLLNHESLNHDFKIQLIEKQRDRVSNLSEVTEELWTSLISNNCVAANWKNVIEYYLLSGEEIDEELRGFFNNISNASSLGEKSLSFKLLDRPKRLKFYKQLILDNEILNNAYNLLLKGLLISYDDISSLDFDPDLFDEKKIQFLIERKKMNLTTKNYSYVRENFFPLHLKLIIMNRGVFYDLINDINLTSDDINLLLRDTGLATGSKKKIISSIKFGNYELTKELANIMLDLYSKNKLSITYDLLIRVFKLTTNTSKQIVLLSKNIYKLNKGQLESLILEIGSPYRRIAIKGKRPRIPNSSLNQEFALKLKAKGFISSYKILENKIQIFTGVK